jgi:hypothetical protein
MVMAKRPATFASFASVRNESCLGVGLLCGDNYLPAKTVASSESNFLQNTCKDATTFLSKDSEKRGIRVLMAESGIKLTLKKKCMYIYVCN